MRDLLKRFTTRQSMGTRYSSSEWIGFKSVGTYYASDIHFEVPDNEIWVRFVPGAESESEFNRLCQNLDSRLSQEIIYFNTVAGEMHLDPSRCTYDPVTNIGTIVFDNTVNCIGPGALNPNIVGVTDGFAEIYIPWTVELLEEWAFGNCVNLKTIDLRHTKITEVRDNAFNNCSRLQVAYFPNSLSSFGADVFANDTELTYLDLGGNNSIYDNVQLDMGMKVLHPKGYKDDIYFTQPIADLVGNSKNLTVRCNRRNLPRRQSTLTSPFPSFLHAGNETALTGNVTVLCPFNRISSFTECQDNNDGTPWQEISGAPKALISRSIYDGPKVFESLEMYHVKNVDFRYRTDSRRMSIYRGNGTIDTPFYINSSQKELFKKSSSSSPHVAEYANGYGEAGAFIYITNYLSPMTVDKKAVLVACDKNHLIYHNGKYFSSVCFGADIPAPTIKVYLVHLTHRNAVAELELSTSGSSATARVENIQSYHV